jgi:hypothetical protein
MTPRVSDSDWLSLFGDSVPPRDPNDDDDQDDEEEEDDEDDDENVAWPPGRAMLTTKPSPTGSEMSKNTTGFVRVS